MRGLVSLLVLVASIVGVSPRATAASTSAVCPDGALPIPAGTFAIGTRSTQEFPDNERPRHLVTLSRGYCLDRTEVTVEAYARCVDVGRCPARAPAFSGATMPMTNVSWSDARATCAFRGGRLPTEVEWEHAARGVDDRLYPWGSFRPHCGWADSMYELGGHCNGYGPSAVGSFPKGASPYGVLDLAGNVLEWVDDAYDDDAYRWLDPLDPHDDDEWAYVHVVRGGSWEYDVVHSLRSSERSGYPSTLRDATLGFRCAYDVPP